MFLFANVCIGPCVNPILILTWRGVKNQIILNNLGFAQVFVRLHLHQCRVKIVSCGWDDTLSLLLCLFIDLLINTNRDKKCKNSTDGHENLNSKNVYFHKSQSSLV